MQFIDAYSFDVRSVKKTCVHIVHPDGRLIPFDTYNLFYRDGLEQSRARAAQTVGGTVDARGDVMKRVLAVLLIATLTTMMIGIDRTSWASQDRDQAKREKQRAAVMKALGEMTRGSTATIERQDGQKMDVVIEEITPDAVTFMRQHQDQVVTETIPIADIATIKKASAKKMSRTSKVLIVTAVALGVLVGTLAAACSTAYSERSGTTGATH